MIVLDTNVISAFMQREVNPVVVSWLNRQPAESIWTTAITVLEVRMGLEMLAAGRRRSALELAFAKMIEDDLERRVLPFDTAAAEAAGRIAAERRRSGRSLEIRDVQIAGIATARNAAIATRNVRHFQELDVAVIDPWTAER